MMGTKRLALSGDFEADSLADALVKEWVPFVDCDKVCARVDNCPFAQALPDNPERHRDIRCGVMVAFIQNYLRSTFKKIDGKHKSAVESYLHGLYHLSQFVLNAEALIALATSDENVRWYGEASPFIFSAIARLRDDLNVACGRLRDIPELSTTSGILLVEGWSEKQLLDRLRMTNSTWFSDKQVIVYGGSANVRPRRIQMLIEDYVGRGYTVYIEGDGDGGEADKFQDLRSKCKIPPEQTFLFRHDLESAIPTEMLHSILRRLCDDVNAVGYAQFRSVIDQHRDAPVAEVVLATYGIDLDAIIEPRIK
jgi:hypothetical protein